MKKNPVIWIIYPIPNNIVFYDSDPPYGFRLYTGYQSHPFSGAISLAGKKEKGPETL